MVGRKRLAILLMAAALIVPGAVFAQQGGGGDRPAPSGSGGTAGSPGMSGAALNTGTREGGGGQAGGEQPGGGGQPGGERPQPGAGQPGGGERPQPGGGAGQPGGGERPQPGGQGGGERPSPGSGLNFSERGTGNLPLELPTMSGDQPAWMSRFSSGGFGTRSFGGDMETQPAMDEAAWRPDNMPENMPEAPAAFDDLTGIAEAQTNAQIAVNEAITSGTEQAQQAADSATQGAQEAYDQFWHDYYTAVDTTAQVYYDTVTATADYLVQSYETAVDYTAQTVNYYIAYAEQYAYYCSLYPWDCYSYAYDSATNAYTYVGDVSDAPTSTTTIGDVTINVSYPVNATPAPSADAYEALVVFANDQLGAVIEPLYAGLATDAVQQMIAYLPDDIEASFLNATAISSVTYWGLLAGGAAAVSVGDCSTNPANCTVTADNLSVQLSSASAGMYGILAGEAVPTTPEAALALITTVYPKLDGLAFAQITDVETGYAFTATTASVGYDAVTRQPISTAKIVYAGVVQVNGAPFVYAVVGLGEGYVNLMD